MLPATAAQQDNRTQYQTIDLSKEQLKFLTMKTFAIISSLIILLSVGAASAQSNDNGDPRNKQAQAQTQFVKIQDPSLLDRLQKETEDVSAVKPLLFLAS